MKRQVFCIVIICMLFTLLITGCDYEVSEDVEAADTQETADTKETTGNNEDNEKTQQVNPVFIAEGIKKLSIISAGEEILNISYEPREYESSYEYWKIYEPYGEEATVDTEAMLELYNKLAELQMEEYTDASDAIINEIKQTTTKVTIEFNQTDDESKAVKATADSTATLFLTKKVNNYYAAYEGDLEKIYLVNKENIEEIMNTNTFDLILKISATASVDTVESVEITIDDKKYVIEVNEDEDASLYTELLSVLIQEEMKEERDEDSELLMKIQFVRNTDEIPNLIIEYYNYNDSMASVSVNGEEHFLVDKEEVEDLKEQVRNL